MIWCGKSAATAVDIFLALQEANIDGPEIKKIIAFGSANFQIFVAGGDDEMTDHAYKIAREITK